MPLPLPPQLPIAPAGQAHQGIQQPPAGTLPYRPNTGASVLQGIAALMNDTRASMQAERDKAKNEFKEQLEMLQQGFPLDLKKVAASAKKAGIPLDFNAPSAEQINYQKASEQRNNEMQWGQQMQAPAPPQPGNPVAALGQQMLMGAGQQMMNQPPPTPPTSGGTPPQEGLMARIGQAFGLSKPNIADNSPGMMQLAAMMRAGREGQDTKQLQAQAQHNIALIQKAALAGDPKAVEMYTRLGGMKELQNELPQLREAARSMGLQNPESAAANLLLDKYSGGPQMRQAKLQAAIEQMKNEVSQRVKVQEMAINFMQTFPGLDPQVAVQAAVGSIAGDTELFTGAMEVLKKHKSKYQMEAEDMLGKSSRDERRVKADETRVGFDQQRLGFEGRRVEQEDRRLSQGDQQLSISRQKLDLDAAQFNHSVVKGLSEAYGKQFDDWYRIASNKDLPAQTRDTALGQMVNAANQMGTIKFTSADGTEKSVSVGGITKGEMSGILGMMEKPGELTPRQSNNLGPAGPKDRPDWLIQLLGTLDTLQGFDNPYRKEKKTNPGGEPH